MFRRKVCTSIPVVFPVFAQFEVLVHFIGDFLTLQYLWYELVPRCQFTWVIFCAGELEYTW